VGCGVCVLACPDGALGLVPRPESEVQPVPENLVAWGLQRSAARGIDIFKVL
jgi:ferredoxin